MLVKQADTVKSRVNDGKPATGEVRQLVEQTVKVQTFVDAHPIPTAVTNWQDRADLPWQASAGLRSREIAKAAVDAQH